MIDDRDLEEMFYGQGRELSLMNFMKIRDLRVFLRTSQEKLEELKKDSLFNQDKILLVGTILEAVKREVHRLERKSLYLEFGFE